MPRGRRPGGVDTRGEILAAAKRVFAANGFERSSLRAIAREAAVDPALVHHYFDGKTDLFAQVYAPELEVRPTIEPLLAELSEVPVEEHAGHFLRRYVESGDSGNPESYRTLVRGFFDGPVDTFGPVRLLSTPLTAYLEARGQDEAVLRGVLCSTLLAGIAFTRWILQAPSYTRLSPAQVAGLHGEELQRWLYGELSIADAAR